MELNKIYNIDCLEGMKLIPDKSIDMVLCDLPYGVTKNKWDTVIPLDKLWEQYKRIIKDDGAIVLFAQTPFDKILGASNLKMLRYEWIWKKTVATGFLNAKRMPLKAHENILVFYKKAPVYNPQMRKGFKPYSRVGRKGYSGTVYNEGRKSSTVSNGDRYPISILEFPKDTQKSSLHPTQKPLKLCEYLIKTYTDEGQTVLDNCIGSGTTAVACTNTNRNFIGFELDKDYYQKSIERIKNNIAQMGLF